MFRTHLIVSSSGRKALPEARDVNAQYLVPRAVGPDLVDELLFFDDGAEVVDEGLRQSLVER